jgi:hypothetical protein
MSVMQVDPTRLGAVGAAFAVGMLVSAVLVSADGSGPPAAEVPSRSPSAGAFAATPEPSASPGAKLQKVGGVPAATAAPTVDPFLLPYPYMSPTPSPTATVLDGTWMRILTLRDVGGARIGLPFRCLRCPPYRVDAGVSTIMFVDGAYYLHHQISDFKTQGSFVVEGDRVTLFNDPNCPQEPGEYRFEVTKHALRFEVIDDDCPWSGERAIDLMRTPWTDLHVCARWVKHLWPGAVAC